MSVIVVCETCGLAFGVNGYRAGTARYCSRACKGMAKRNRKSRVCERCGCLFWVPTSRPVGRFCSVGCGPDYVVDEVTGCWNWARSIDDNGYGRFFGGLAGSFVMAHRWVYENHKGLIPEGLVLDHLCMNRKCVNPDHLDPVTDQVNIIRGPRIQAARSAELCPNGHRWTPENTYIAPRSGSRVCRKCNYEKSRKYLARRRSASLLEVSP